MAPNGTVAMAQDGDSEPVTRAMIAAGLSQLLPMDETFAHLVETVEAVYRAMRKVARAGPLFLWPRRIADRAIARDWFGGQAN